MENSKLHCKKMSPAKKIVMGAMVMGAGVLLLLFNLGLIEDTYREFVFSWQSLLIAVGVVNLFSRENQFTGVVAILAGAFFLAPEITYIPFSIWDVFLPAALIIGGIYIIFKKFTPHSERLKKKIRDASDKCRSERGENCQVHGIEEVNLFSGGKRLVTDSEFEGGTIINIFGGMELDLRQTSLKNEITVIETVNIFGGLSLIVPSSWEIKTEAISILGGFADKRTDLAPSNDSKKLIIKGVNVFGGGELKTTVWVKG